MHYKVWGEITYPFPNFNRWSLVYDYLRMLGLELIRAILVLVFPRFTGRMVTYAGVEVYPWLP